MEGLQRSPQHKYRFGESEWVPGVTSIIAKLDKSGVLVNWAKRETAACAVRNLSMLNEMVKGGGPDAAINWLKTIPDFQRDKAADLGTRVHTLAEAISRGQDITVAEDEAPFIESYMRWRDEHQPRVLHAEYMVYSEKHHYGGTADMVAHIGSELWLIDAKTGRGAYAETALQLAALHYADFAGKPGDPTRYRLPKATRFGVLHVRPEGAELIPYDVGKQEFAAFLACRTLYDWQEKRAPVVKQPIAVKEAA